MALSNQVGKRKSTVLMGKFRKSSLVEQPDAPQQLDHGSVTNSTPSLHLRGPSRKRGHIRTHSVPISTGNSSSEGGSEIDFTDLDFSILSKSSGGGQISFAGASIFVDNKQLNQITTANNKNILPTSPPSPLSAHSASSTSSFDQSNMPPQPEFDDGIMNQHVNQEQEIQRVDDMGMTSLFSRFSFDIRDLCPNCNFELNDQDIRNGWTLSTQEYRTSCPQCQIKFVPRFTVIIDKVGEQRKELTTRKLATAQLDAKPSPPEDVSESIAPNEPVITFTNTVITNSESRQTISSSQVPPSNNKKFFDTDFFAKRTQQSTNRLAENLKNIMSAIKSKQDGTNNTSTIDDSSFHTNSASSDNISTNYDDVRAYHKLKYEYLSPIVLKKEVENLLSKEVTADAKLFKEHPLIFWNLICHFRGLLIPLNFLLPQVDWLAVMEELTSMIEGSNRASNNSESNSSTSLEDDTALLERLEKMNSLSRLMNHNASAEVDDVSK